MKNLFEYDSTKNQRNKERHGIDFEQAQALWKSPHWVMPAKDSKGESRSFILAKLEGRLYMAVFTNRKNFIRIITCHRADRRLERRFKEAQDETQEKS